MSIALLPTLSVACDDNALLSLALVPTLSVACGGNALLSIVLLPILYVACKVRKTRNVTVIVVPPVTGHLANMSSR